MKPPSNRRSKEYKKIIKQGCGGFQDPYHGDYDCQYQYDWNCEDCPINKERKDTREPMSINPVTFFKAKSITVTKPEHNTPQIIRDASEGIHPHMDMNYRRTIHVENNT